MLRSRLTLKPRFEAKPHPLLPLHHTCGNFPTSTRLTHIGSRLCSKSTGENGPNDKLFTYDHLNRLTSFHKIINPVESYSIDPWGNMQRQPIGTNPLVFPTSNRLPGMTCTQIGGSSAFDGAGNQLCDGNPAFTGTVHEYTYNPDNQITNITDGSGNPIATYTLNGDGGRVRKDLPDGSWKEYMAAGGEVMSELDQNGNWTDYIYAAGQKIAKVENFDVRLHIAGLCPATTSACYTGWNIPAPSSYTVRNGDKLMWRQYESSGYGGFDVVFSNGVQTWQSWYDLQGDGEVMGLGVQSQWTYLSADLSPYAGTSMLAFILMVGTYPGPFDMMFGDIAIVSADGTVTPIYNRQLGITPSLAVNYGSATNLTAASEQVLNSANPLTTDAATSTSYYVADHLRTTQMEFNGGGWPIWQGDFDPWGQERDTNTTAMNYKFTGQERDVETGDGGGNNGLDYFHARYYGNGMGRFLSPDNGADQHAQEPQSWNLYEYVRDNPLNSTDPTGRDACHVGGADLCAAIQKGMLDGKSFVEARTAAITTAYNNAVDKLSKDLAKAGAYGRIEEGKGVNVHVKVLGVKAEIGYKDVDVTTSRTQHKSGRTEVEEWALHVAVGPLKIGPSASREGVEQVDNGPRTFDPPLGPWHGNFLWDFGEHGRGSNWELGTGMGGCFGVCASGEVGFDAQKVGNFMLEHPAPELITGLLPR